jgi:acyl carrier protein
MNIPVSFLKILYKIDPIELKDIIIDFEPNIDLNKSWDYNGLDSLDIIEIILKIENKFNVVIYDDDFFGNLKPIELINIANQYNRNNRLDILLK